MLAFVVDKRRGGDRKCLGSPSMPRNIRGPVGQWQLRYTRVSVEFSSVTATVVNDQHEVRQSFIPMQDETLVSSKYIPLDRRHLRFSVICFSKHYLLSDLSLPVVLSRPLD